MVAVGREPIGRTSGAVAQALGGVAEGELGIHPEPTRDPNGLEQQLTHEALRLTALLGIRRRTARLLLARRALGVDPAQHLPRVEQGRQALGQPLQRLALTAPLDLALYLRRLSRQPPPPHQTPD